ncbi:hypothetical protein RTBOTA2_001314, partial [Rhodotorula toruloides]
TSPSRDTALELCPLFQRQRCIDRLAPQSTSPHPRSPPSRALPRPSPPSRTAHKHQACRLDRLLASSLHIVGAGRVHLLLQPEDVYRHPHTLVASRRCSSNQYSGAEACSDSISRSGRCRWTRSEGGAVKKRSWSIYFISQ